MAQGSNSVIRLDPTTQDLEAFPVGGTPYTYSDFLGYQRWLVMPLGLWTHVLERCADKDSTWEDLLWDTLTPSDSAVTICARSADTTEELASAEAVTLGKLLEIVVVLRPSTDIPPQSPAFSSIQAYYSCGSR